MDPPTAEEIDLALANHQQSIAHEVSVSQPSELLLTLPNQHQGKAEIGVSLSLPAHTTPAVPAPVGLTDGLVPTSVGAAPTAMMGASIVTPDLQHYAQQMTDPKQFVTDVSQTSVPQGQPEVEVIGQEQTQDQQHQDTADQNMLREQLEQAQAQAQAQAHAHAQALVQARAQAAHVQAHLQAHQAQQQAQQVQQQTQQNQRNMLVPAPAHPFLPNDPTGRSVPANPYHPLIGHSFENISDARAALDAHAEASGYKLCVMKTLPAAVVWRCSQSGRRKTRVKDVQTPPSKQRKHKLKERSGCRWKIRAVKRPRLVEDGNAPATVQWIWTIRESDNPEARAHNHDMLDPASFASYRMKAAIGIRDLIFTMVDAGVKPVHIVNELQQRARTMDRPDIAAIKSRDIHNLVHARKARAEAQAKAAIAGTPMEGTAEDLDLQAIMEGARQGRGGDIDSDDEETNLGQLGAAAEAMMQGTHQGLVTDETTHVEDMATMGVHLTE